MNNTTTTTYYVTVDANNYVLTASPVQTDGTRKVDIPNEYLNDFFAHMGLYRVYENGRIDYPFFKAATLAAEIDSLKATAEKNEALVSTLTSKLADSQKTIDQLMIDSTKGGN